MQAIHVKRFNLRFWPFFAVLAAWPAAASAEEPLTPLPEPNPQRQVKPSTGTAEVPDAPPPLPGDRPTVAWKDPAVDAARSACAKMLDGLDLDYEQLDPIKKGLCGAPAPIKVRSIGKDPAVVISPPATMTCKLAVTLHAWFKDTVQPSAAELGTSLVKIRNASSYKCRNRYGRTDTRISEHALANALDISEFVFASGRNIKLLGNWPYGALRTFTSPPEPPAPNPHRTADALDAFELGRAETGANNAGTENQSRQTAMRVKINPFVRPVVEASHAPLPSGGSPQDAHATARSPVATAKSNPFVAPYPNQERLRPRPARRRKRQRTTRTARRRPLVRPTPRPF